MVIKTDNVVKCNKRRTHEVKCVDCDADIIAYVGEIRPRCDVCYDHHLGLCGSDCPRTDH